MIDSREVEVEPGGTILDAARKLGIDIPTLCFNDSVSFSQPSTSCMVCVVKLSRGEREGRTTGQPAFRPSGLPAFSLAPACATIAEDGMEIESETDEVHEARRTALELLLSDHVGDCIAPCHRTCPAGMNIPLMIRQIAAGKLGDAIATVKRDIALPAVLGRICSAPCENACRRGAYDSPVSICLLKRYVADMDLMSESPYLPSCKPGNGKRVAIVGAGPTGLAAAYYLLQTGYTCIIFDDHEKPGGMLQYGVPEDMLPREVLDAEIGIVEKLGAEFRMKTKIGEHLSILALQTDYDAVLIATGGDANGLGIQFQMDRNTLQTNLRGIFAGGNATGRRSKMAVRSVADGKTAAASIDQYISHSSRGMGDFTHLAVADPHKLFSVYIGKLAEGEIQRFMADVSEGQRVSPSGGKEAGFSREEAQTEAIRCLHCDCRKADNCKLRDHAGAYKANPNRHKGERKLFEQHVQRPREGEAPAEPCVIYEPGKCIKCGLCIQITSSSSEALGLTFIGRGFDVQVGVPFSRSIEEGLRRVAARCVAACPTGALAFK